MKQSWDDYEKAAEKGPLSILWKIFGAIALICIVLIPLSYIIGWCGEAAQVAQEEFGPRELLRKYEWFKDAAAQLDAKRATIGTLESRQKALVDGYGNSPRSQWAREDREQVNIWVSEVAGVKASYNLLAAEYNAQMAKFNWRFTNTGDLPAGATVPLPREFKPYLTE